MFHLITYALGSHEDILVCLELNEIFLDIIDVDHS